MKKSAKVMEEPPEDELPAALEDAPIWLEETISNDAEEPAAPLDALNPDVTPEAAWLLPEDALLCDGETPAEDDNSPADEDPPVPEVAAPDDDDDDEDDEDEEDEEDEEDDEDDEDDDVSVGTVPSLPVFLPGHAANRHAHPNRKAARHIEILHGSWMTAFG